MGIPTKIGAGSTEAGDISVAEGSIVVGNSSGYGAALSAKTDKQILVGNGTTITSVGVSGDITITNAGVTAIGAGKVLSSMVSPLLVQYATVTLTSANVIALNATPFTVVAAPAAGSVALFLGGMVVISGGTTNYDQNENMTINYTAGAALSTTVANFFNGGVSGKMTTIKPIVTDYTPVAATALSLNCSASPKNAAGDRGAKVHVWYVVVPST